MIADRELPWPMKIWWNCSETLFDQVQGLWRCLISQIAEGGTAIGIEQVTARYESILLILSEIPRINARRWAFGCRCCQSATQDAPCSPKGCKVCHFRKV
jgi:hypothetical protein